MIDILSDRQFDVYMMLLSTVIGSFLAAYLTSFFTPDSKPNFAVNQQTTSQEINSLTINQIVDKSTEVKKTNPDDMMPIFALISVVVLFAYYYFRLQIIGTLIISGGVSIAFLTGMFITYRELCIIPNKSPKNVKIQST